MEVEKKGVRGTKGVQIFRVCVSKKWKKAHVKDRIRRGK